MDYEVKGVRPTGLDLEVGQRKLGVRKDCQTRQLCKKDAMDRRQWRQLIKGVV